MLYILENPPSTIVMLKFATSLVYLGCASLGIWYAARELAIMGTASAESEWRSHSAGRTDRRCRYKITHLWELPALFAEKKQLRQEWADAIEMHQGRSVAQSMLGLGDVQDWTDRQCADWLKWDVNLPEHVPLFMGGAIDGGKLLRLNGPKLQALGIDDADGEIILARLQLLERMYRRSQTMSQRLSFSTSSVLYETAPA